MKRTNKLIIFMAIIVFVILILAATNVDAATYEAVLDKSWSTDEKICTLTITSDALEEGLEVYANTIQSCNIITDDYLLHSNYFYNYTIVHTADNNYYQIDSLGEEEAIIRVWFDGINKDAEYDLYFCDGNYPNITIDEEITDIPVEVVTEDGVNYIQFTTTSMKPFI